MLPASRSSPRSSTRWGWASFALMRALDGEPIDLEEVRGFLKRTGEPEREALLRELAYLAA